MFVAVDVHYLPAGGARAAAVVAADRRIFVAIVVDGIPLDALAAGLGLRRNAIYKVIFDARRKIRRALAAKGYMEEPGMEQR